MPRLDIGVRRRAYRQFQCFVDELAGDRTVGQEHAAGPELLDGLLEIEHAMLIPTKIRPVERMRPLVPGNSRWGR